jgi:hypothetical protein
MTRSADDRAAELCDRQDDALDAIIMAAADRTTCSRSASDDDGHPVQRAVHDMSAGEVIAAIDHLTAASTRIAAREKLARLRQVVAQKHSGPS